MTADRSRGVVARVGDRVIYANGPYVVAQVNGDLLWLVGLVDERCRCRPPITVLASDVQVVGAGRTTPAGEE